MLFSFCGCWWDGCIMTMLTLMLHLFDLLCVFFSPSVRLYQVPITSSQTLCCALTPLTTPITPYWATPPSITTPPSACTTLKVCCILPLLWLPVCVCVCVCVGMFMWFMRTQICIMTWVWQVLQGEGDLWGHFQFFWGKIEMHRLLWGLSLGVG